MTALIQRAKREAAHTIRVEVECDTLDQVREAVDAGADIILFDNMTPEQMKEGVDICRGRALTEASGGITIDNVREAAEAGVDLLSSGSITPLRKGLGHQPGSPPERVSPLRLGLIAAGLLAVAACGDAAPDTPEPPDAQRIVFVGPRFDVWTVRDDGEGLEHIAGEGPSDSSVTLASSRTQRTEGARYTWPTWSPDGTRVALSRIPGLGEDSVAGLVVSDPSGGPERQLHQTRRGSLGFVARDAPHYAFWAPTSQFLSFVAPRAPGRGLGLFSVDPERGDPHQVAANAPLYHVWSPDGTLMLAHRREDLLLYDSADHSTRDLGARSLRYRAPAFSPDGERIAYVVDEGGTGKLVTSKVDGSDRVTVMDVPGEAAFAYSPRRRTHRCRDEAVVGAALRQAVHRGRGRRRRAAPERPHGCVLLVA